MVLYHFTEKPFSLKDKKKYQVINGINKPSGLWLSDENDYGWSQWCQDNDFRLKGLKYKTTIKVDTSNVFVIQSVEELKEFNSKYGIKKGNFKKDPYFLLEDYFINWDLLKNTHKGIIITPYLHQVRLEYMWYYGWDCASGCIWDTSCCEIITQSKTMGE